MSLAVHKYLRPKEWPTHISNFARVAPMLAGVMAPFSVLLDIPALSVCDSKYPHRYVVNY